MTFPLVEACWKAIQVGDVQALTTGLEALKAHLPEVSFHVIIHWVVPIAFKCETPDMLDFLAHYDSGFPHICYVNSCHFDKYLAPIVGKHVAGWPEQQVLAIVQHLVDHRRRAIVYPPGVNPMTLHEDDIVIFLDYLRRAIVDAYKFAHVPDLFENIVLREEPREGPSVIDARYIIGRINTYFGEIVIASVAIAGSKNLLAKIMKRLAPAYTANDGSNTMRIASRFMRICAREFGARGYLDAMEPEKIGTEHLIEAYNGSVAKMPSCAGQINPQIICDFALEHPGKVALIEGPTYEQLLLKVRSMSLIAILDTLLSCEYIAPTIITDLQSRLGVMEHNPIALDHAVAMMCEHLESYISLDLSMVLVTRIADICHIIGKDNISQLIEHHVDDYHEGAQLLREIIAAH